MSSMYDFYIDRLKSKIFSVLSVVIKISYYTPEYYIPRGEMADGRCKKYLSTLAIIQA